METNRKFLTFTVLMLAFLSIWASISSINDFYLSEFSEKAVEEQNLYGPIHTISQERRSAPCNPVKEDLIQRPYFIPVEINDSMQNSIYYLLNGDMRNPSKKANKDMDGLKDNFAYEFTF